MHTPVLLDEVEHNSIPNTLTPVYPLRWVPWKHNPWTSLVRHSEWIDALGRKVFLDPGPSRQPKVPAYLIDLDRSWDESDLDTDEFSEWVSSFTLSGEEVYWCEDCGDPIFDTFSVEDGARQVCQPCLDNNYTTCGDCDENYRDTTSVEDGDREVCESCLQRYEPCDECEELVRDTTTVEDGDRCVCEACIDNYYYWCESCDDYYREEHDHHRGDCCESPKQEFSLRIKDGSISQDERLTVTLPEGVTSTGFYQIQNLIHSHVHSLEAPPTDWRRAVEKIHGETIGTEWVTGKGTLPKRISRFLHREAGISLPATVLAEIGNVAKRDARSGEFHVEVTRDLNLDADEFAHGGSCWWTEYAVSRCILKTNGGFGLRCFGKYGSVAGRSWVMPMKRQLSGPILTPTFNTDDPDAYVVFNNYGDLGEGIGPVVFAHMLGWVPRRIDFSVDDMWVNHDDARGIRSGHLITPTAEDFADLPSLRLSIADHSSLYRDETTTTERTSNVA
jgi:hypothetical protein